MIILNLLAILVGLLLSAYEFDQDIEVGENFGKNIAVPHNYSSLRYSNRYELSEMDVFGMARAHYLKGSKWATNLGIGFRRYRRSFQLDFNLFYDSLMDAQLQNQLGIGTGILSNSWGAFCNIYLPLGKKTHVKKSVRFDYPGGYMVKCIQKQTSMSGIDFECGKLFDRFSSFFKVYGGIGGYGYRGKNVNDVYGVRARINGDFWNKVKTDFIVTHDKIFKTSFQFSLSFYYGNNVASSIKRQEVIVREPTCYSWETNY